MFKYNSMNIIFACLICGIRSGQFLENIAYNKPAYQSSLHLNVPKYEANKALDGNINTVAHCDREPDTLNWWKVDLMSEYYISQVILTPRKGVDEDVQLGRMDYVYIGITNLQIISGKVKYPVYPLCRQSPHKVIGVNNTYPNITISCRPNAPPGRYVVVQLPSTSTGYLTISEVQVYGFKLENNSLENSTCQGNYYGENCDKYCNCDKGVKCDQQGNCPNGCDVNWEGQHCDIRKYNRNQLVGCFQLSNSSSHEFPRTQTSSCMTTCSGFGFTYASYKTFNVCICSDSLNWTVPMTCGFEDNVPDGYEVTFYAVCPNATYGYNCTLKCNCLNNGRCSYMEGHCEDGCASGWTGESCDIRDCLKENGGCGSNEICVSNSSELTSCQCKEGYNRTSDLSSCQSFKVCANGTYGHNCTLKCNCLNNGRCSYMEGHCKDGCANGWSGDSCDIRDCSRYNGGCSEKETCVSNSSDVTACECKAGFNRTSISSPCQSLSNSSLDDNFDSKTINAAEIIGGIFGAVAGLTFITAPLIIFTKRKYRDDEDGNYLDE